MKVLFLAAELSPLAKVGGLGDVAGELPIALVSMGVDLRIGIPFHQNINRDSIEFRKSGEILIPHSDGSQRSEIFQTTIGELDIHLIDGPPIAAVEGIYSNMEEDAYKFTFFSLAAMRAAEVDDWQPDILHAHDWHASPAITWLKRNRQAGTFWERTASLLTVHNLPYMGAGSGAALSSYGLDPVSDPRLPDWAQHMPLPMGLASADWINAVSPTYAQEIRTPAFGHGLEDLIIDKRDHVLGILNGIDRTRWDPETDAVIPVNYSREHLRERAKARSALREEFDLPDHSTVPLIAMITRLGWQKGADLAIKAMPKLSDIPWQFILLGTGDPGLEQMARDFEAELPTRVRSLIQFDPDLSRRIYAGADMMLIPSRYEPCGLTQMIAMRYGCVPVVAATGGLKDTVTDYRQDPKGTGFVFDLGEGEGIKIALRNAISNFQDKRRWRGLQLRGMAQDFSWDRSAREYQALYKRAHKDRIKST